MAYNKAPALAMIALILFAAANPLAHAQPAQFFNSLNVVGQICCTPTGTCTTGAAPVPGVVVSLNCSRLVGATVTLSNATTNATGFFNISVPNTLPILAVANTLPCVVAVKLPLNQTVCPVLNTATGTIAALPTFVNTEVSSVLGTVANFIASVFFNVSVAAGV